MPCSVTEMTEAIIERVAHLDASNLHRRNVNNARFGAVHDQIDSLFILLKNSIGEQRAAALTLQKRMLSNKNVSDNALESHVRNLNERFE